MDAKFQRVAAEKLAMLAQSERPASTPETRGATSRSLAAARAAEIFERDGWSNASHDGAIDAFYLPPGLVPEGWDYGWKRWATYNKADPSYELQLRHEGWVPVDLHRDEQHERMMPSGWEGNTIEREGMLLMVRPMEVTLAVLRREYKLARDQVQTKEAQLAGTPDGTMDRSRPTLRKSFDMPIPGDL